MKGLPLFGLHRPPAPAGGNLESKVQQIGRELLDESRRHGASVTSGRFWKERLMRWAMEDAAFRTQLFRFIDVFSALRTPAAVREHLVQYLKAPGIKLPAGLSFGMAAAGIFADTAASTIAAQIEAMSRTFIAGRDLPEAAPLLRQQWNAGIAFSVDLLGEACVSDLDATAYVQRYADLIELLPETTAGWAVMPRLERDHLGALPRCSISIKVSSLDGHVSPVDTEGSVKRLFARVSPLLYSAAGKGVLVYFDMEQHELQEITLTLFRRCCEEIDFPAGLALQAYLVSAEQDARELMEWAHQKRRSIFVRLIKGAYWDYETAHARQMNWTSPVWEHKAQTDACFERLTRLLLQQTPRKPGAAGVRLAVGSHNTRSVAHALACLEEFGLPQDAIEFQLLRGMADDLKTALVSRNCRVREYVPLGEMLPGMAYLVRRLLENSSNQGFIRASQSESLSDQQLLAPPQTPPQFSKPCEAVFANEPHRDFSDARQRKLFASAVAAYTLPLQPPEQGVDAVAETVATASDAFARWRDRPPRERTKCLLMAADILHARRDNVAALEIHEAQKTWAEADADVCEAIDFCRYYASESLRLFEPQRLTELPGETNHLLHEPRGVAVVISPWNFPLAICTGMAVAALVTGNTVILKPAEQTPLTAHEICKALWEAGVPRDVLHFMPGRGETVGAALVRDPRVALIAFTGSSAVGLGILAAAAPQATAPRLPLKHVVCEMGGKNAIIIDATADLDEAVPAVRASAFGYAGQKCSACSRVIVVDEVHDVFLQRLLASTASVIVGNSADPATDVPPLINDEAASKVWKYIEIGQTEGTLRTPRTATSSGRLVAPHIFDDVPPTARIASEEIFGPVLSVIRARDFDEALRIANAAPYRLTGGVFSRTPSHLDLARREFRVGDLYLNRGITGALVGRQPFGGFGLSGLGTQAGGPEYLLHFVHPRSVSENTLRRGFVPESNE